MHDTSTITDTDADLDRQMVAIARGESSILVCCDLFQSAITAVMYAVIEQRRIDHFRRIQDGLAKAQNN